MRLPYGLLWFSLLFLVFPYICTQNKRYDDIRRWGIGTETMSGPIYGAWNPNDEAFVLIETRACVFPKYDSWPLPQQEETANSNIKQPTGW